MKWKKMTRHIVFMIKDWAKKKIEIQKLSINNKLEFFLWPSFKLQLVKFSRYRYINSIHSKKKFNQISTDQPSNTWMNTSVCVTDLFESTFFRPFCYDKLQYCIVTSVPNNNIFSKQISPKKNCVNISWNKKTTTLTIDISGEW